MALPYVRTVRFLSPSSLYELENDPITFYLKRLGPLEYVPPQLPQTGPMAVGTVFDAHVKTYLGHLIKQPVPMNLIRDNVAPQHLEIGSVVLEEGLRLFKLYRESPALQQLIEEGLDRVEVPTDTVTVGTHKLIGKEFGGVPIYGKPDARMSKNGIMTVLDWKVNGSLSQTGASPHKGYLRLWDGRSDLGPHKSYGMFLEDLNAGWAAQLVMYHWMLGDMAPGNDMFLRCAIEQVVVRPDGVKFAQLRAPVSPNFQAGLLARLQGAWARIQEQRVVDESQFGDDVKLLSLIA